MKSKRFIVSAVIFTLLIVAGITFLCIASAIMDERRYADGVERIAFEPSSIAIESYRSEITLKKGTESSSLDDTAKKDELIKALDTGEWYYVDDAEKSDLTVTITTIYKKKHVVILCEDNVICIGGKYMKNKSGSVFHDAVVNAMP